MYQIHNCSPKARAFIDPNLELDPRPLLEVPTLATKYPFKRMQIGHCFVIPYSELKENDYSHIKKAASLASNKSIPVKKFKVIRHDEECLIEVARIA